MEAADGGLRRAGSRTPVASAKGRQRVDQRVEDSLAKTALSLPEHATALASANQLMRFAQQESFFHLALRKQQRQRALREYFAGKCPRRILVGANLGGFAYEREGFEVLQLAADHFAFVDEAERAARLRAAEDAIVIVNNNDIGRDGNGPGYADFYERSPHTIFIAWDWDNHHWLENSTQVAVNADLYVPAHHENLYLLTRYNASTVGPVYCATVQWSRRFLAGQLPALLAVPRSDAPLGMHVAYASFEFRNRVVATLNQRYASVGFSNHAFHGRGADDRLAEWAAHKAHWIIPVLNDVPIRLFDALVTGGIPLVPESMRHLPPVSAMPRDYVVFYTPEDVVNPEAVVARANHLFDSGGADKLVERHRYALDLHHANERLERMLRAAAAQYDLADFS